MKKLSIFKRKNSSIKKDLYDEINDKALSNLINTSNIDWIDMSWLVQKTKDKKIKVKKMKEFKENEDFMIYTVSKNKRIPSERDQLSKDMNKFFHKV